MTIPGVAVRPAVFDRTATRRAPAWALSILVFGAAGYCALFLSAVTSDDGQLLQALTIVPILFALTIPIALRVARSDGDPTLTTIVLAALVAKFIGAWARHWVAYVYYGGNADSLQYDIAGRMLAPGFRQLDFTTNLPSLIGTGFIKMFTGVVYAVFGMSRLGGFMVFAWLGFLGLLLMTRAFKLGVPTGSPRRYLLAVLFVPSLVYWPSAIGKEAWMMLALGLTAYGVAGLFRRRSGGLVAFVVGMLALIAVRPHIALIVFVGLALALLLRRAPARTYAAPMLRVLGLVALLVLGVLLAGRTASFLGEPRLTTETVSEQLTATQEQTTDGGSAFTPVQVNTPLDLVPATVTVFFRPFPFEVLSLAELASAAEGVLLVGLLLTSRKRVRSVTKMLRTTPYVTFCMGYLLAFVYAFSAFANFGILARQRTQAIPFLLVLLALPDHREITGRARPVAKESAGAAGTAGGEAPPAPARSRRRLALAATAGTVSPARLHTTSLEGTEGIRRRNRPPATVAAGPATAPAAPGPATAVATTTTSGRAPVSSGTTFPPPPRGPRATDP